ncbi:MAG: pentapeptide repeat-containing protein [Plectolyngbya sp. WJT66-NPBG17]|jgi:uncharacterized protein YjbI with pentapeptide repeats|nr:pentapeptide repeat-containing protein [Plectolyngbya sp. WJT66-NPBG17]
MQDFSGKNLCGRNFTGQDLRGANFSNADIRGANFSKADLSRANFTGAKAGLQKRWLFAQLVISFVLSATLNFVAAVINGAFIAYLFSEDSIRDATILPGIISIGLLATVYLAIARQGLTTRAFITIAVAVAFAGTGAVAVAFAVAGAVAFAVAVAVLSGLLSLYVVWRVSKNDEKFELARTFGVAFSSLGGTHFYNADLTGANFTNATLKSTNFRDATLTHVCWRDAKKLDRARVGNSILQHSAIRELLVEDGYGYKKSFIAANLEGANLQGVNLEAANLTRANLSNALLHCANLKAANLRETLVIEADFTGAYLTGACIEAWNIDHTTKLDRVDCQYIFLLDQPNALGSRERRPHAPDTVFAPGDFEKLYKKIINTVQILMRNGINPEAFAAGFQQLMQENPDITHDSIQSFEKKGNDVLLTLEVPEGTHKAQIAQSFELTYRDRIQQLEAENKQHLLDFKTMAMDIAKHPARITNVLTAGNQTMNDSSINIGGNVTGSTINLGEISGSVSNVVNQLPSTPDQPGLKEHLIELQAAIETEPVLSLEDKADALEEVKTLAEAAQDPQKQGLGGKAIRGLKRMIGTLPDAAKLAKACSKLLPLIAKAIGLPVP